MKHLDEFASERKNVIVHIPSKYSTEMASMSKTVCCTFVTFQIKFNLLNLF